MIARFSLYGFLKNQRYFDPFLVLAFLDSGLSFFAIGLLVALRELTVNILEVPSGALADLYGRKRVLMASFLCYLGGFLALGLTSEFWLYGAAMIGLGIGDAFRSGTHKAMIFAWLKSQGRQDEKTKVYGYTRSWSKLGSALSAVIAAIYVGLSDSYQGVFILSALPCLLSIANIATYPNELNGVGDSEVSLRSVYAHTKTTLKESLREAELRRLFLESMGFEGFLNAAKDYLQALLQISASVALLSLIPDTWTLTQKSAALVGPAYFLVFVGSAVASRQAPRFAGAFQSEQSAARALWALNALLFAAFTLSTLSHWLWGAALALILSQMIQNIWRPILVSRIDERCEDARKVTVLSMESQARKASTLLFAPLLGFLVDLAPVLAPGSMRLWPVGAVGLLVALGFLLWPPSKVQGKSLSGAQ